MVWLSCSTAAATSSACDLLGCRGGLPGRADHRSHRLPDRPDRSFEVRAELAGHLGGLVGVGTGGPSSSADEGHGQVPVREALDAAVEVVDLSLEKLVDLPGGLCQFRRFLLLLPRVLAGRLRLRNRPAQITGHVFERAKYVSDAVEAVVVEGHVVIPVLDSQHLFVDGAKEPVHLGVHHEAGRRDAAPCYQKRKERAIDGVRCESREDQDGEDRARNEDPDPKPATQERRGGPFQPGRKLPDGIQKLIDDTE
jgi:hypothetical protein